MSSVMKTNVYKIAGATPKALAPHKNIYKNRLNSYKSGADFISDNNFVFCVHFFLNNVSFELKMHSI